MVKGISRQVMVVHSPDPKLFEEALFILKEDALGKDGVSEDALLLEANRLSRGNGKSGRKCRASGPMWAICGAGLTGRAWLVSTFL